MRSLQSPTLIRNIAKNLVLKRLESGLTQTQVAQTLGVTFQQAQKFESGNNTNFNKLCFGGPHPEEV